MANGYLRLAAEQAPNAEGGANAVSTVTFDVPVSTAKFEPKPTPIDINDELRGFDDAAPHLGAGSYEPAASFTVRVYPGVLAALLLGACGGVTTTPGNGAITDPDSQAIPVGAHRHVFSWGATDTPQTFQATGSPPRGLFYRAQGLGFESVNFAVADGSWQAEVAARNLYTAIISDPSITPAVETPMPFVAGTMTLAWLSGSAVTEEFTWKLEQAIETVYGFSVESLFPDVIQFTDAIPGRVLGGTINKQSMDADDWAAFIAGTTFAATIKMVHRQVIGATAYHHTLWVEMPACQYVEGEIGEITNTRRHKATYNWEARYDTATSKWATITLVNATAALATYA
jgi:hypothetical protein